LAVKWRGCVHVDRPGQYREATADLLQALTLLQQVYSAELAGYTDVNTVQVLDKLRHDSKMASSATLRHDVTVSSQTGPVRRARRETVAAIARLVDSLTAVFDRMQYVATGNKLPDDPAVVFMSQARDVVANSSGAGQGASARQGQGGAEEVTLDDYYRRYSHAEQLFQAAHIMHFCSIGILGLFVLQVYLTFHSSPVLTVGSRVE
jgi:hypothetical protein